MKMKENKKHSLYYELFHSNFNSVFILIIVITSIFFYIIDNLIVSKNIEANINIAEKSADNLSYSLQQNISLAYTLARNESVLYNIRKFPQASYIEQVDYDLALTDIFEKYTNYNSGMTKIRIFLPENITNSTAGYRTVQYLSVYNDPEWLCFFQNNSSTLVTDYSCHTDFYTYFTKDNSKLAIIVPIIEFDTTLAFLVIDVDKDALFSHFFNKNTYTIVNNRNAVIYNTSNISIDEKSMQYLNDAPGTAHIIINNSKNKTLCYATSKTTHGFKILQFIPYSTLVTHRHKSTIILFALLLLISVISLYSARKKALKFTLPLSMLADAMKLRKTADTTNVSSTEISVLYDTYNEMLLNNKIMLSDINESNRKYHQAEIKALLAQISPHFLYNTLNTIVWNALKSNQTEICSIISKLAKLCKLTYNHTSDFVTLTTELRHVELYLQLQQEAFEQPFDYNITLPYEYAELKVPRFILQPIVENTILHGFSQLITNGHIEISVIIDSSLIISIHDNGTGIMENDLEKLNSNTYQTEKYGIENINQRIKLLCGEEYGIFFESDGHSYTKATITLPVLYNQPDPQ